MKVETMAKNLRGNLGLRSSPLCPTSSKLTTQYLVLDHMNNHYNKISKAKPAIDNKPPKALATSQRMRDQRTREHVKRTGPMRPTYGYSRPQSAADADGDIYDETLWDDPEDEQERQVLSVMRATLRHRGQGSADATYGSEAPTRNHHQTQRPMSATGRPSYQEFQRRPMSSRSTLSLASNVSRASLGATLHKSTYDGDVLDKHSHVFTEPAKPFTPRTLKSNRQSRLRQSGCYNAPPKKQLEEKEMNSTVVKAHELEGRQERPKPAARKKPPHALEEDTLTETSEMFQSLQTRDMRHFQKDKQNPNNVPPLEITMDTDHMKWIQEQADKAELRSRSARKATMGHISEEGSARSTLNQDTQQSMLYGSKSLLRSRMNEAEEEQKYVKFAQDVTQDVLNRGIFSDSVLQQVFESHIERNKKHLDARRLRAIVEQLKRDLGLGEGSKDVYYGKLGTDSGNVSRSLRTTHQGFGTLDSGTGLQDSLYSANSLGFGTADPTLLSTVQSQQEDLSATQALEHYQRNLSTQEARQEARSEARSEVRSEFRSEADHGHRDHKIPPGERNGDAGVLDATTAVIPQVKPRKAREVHATTVITVQPKAPPSDGKESVKAVGRMGGGEESDAVSEVSGAPTVQNAHQTEEEAEDDANDGYEDDYDADEDGQSSDGDF